MEDKIAIIEDRIMKEEHTGQQLLGKFLIDVAMLNILELICKAVIRFIFKGQTMLISGYEAYLSMLRLLLVVIAFIYCIKRMNKLFFHSPDTKKLVVLWGVILIPIQLINDMTVMLYTRMLELLQHVLSESAIDGDGQIFAMIYDSTHGFKYICIFLAILLGIVMTGELLEKRKLLILCAVFAVMFMIAFTAFRMQTIEINTIATYEIGINWTSTIFHALTTFGLMFIGFYIYKEFKKEAPLEKEIPVEKE